MALKVALIEHYFPFPFSEDDGHLGVNGHDKKLRGWLTKLLVCGKGNQLYKNLFREPAVAHISPRR